MTSYFKKAYSSLMGFGDPSLLPPQEFISEEDCSTCLHPCEEHKQYPSYLNIDQDYPLLGTVKPYGRHIIIATGTSDWSRKIEWVQGSFAYSLTSVWGNKRSWKNLITNSSMTSLYSTEPNSCDVIIFPDNIIVSNVTNEKAKEFWNLFVDKPLPTEPVDIETLETGSMKISKVPYKSVLLLCSHKKRDKRCGLTAPILAQEFDHLFRQKDLSEEDAMILMVSHFGGKFHYTYEINTIINIIFFYIRSPICWKCRLLYR
jgi:hypothetical protein